MSRVHLVRVTRAAERRREADDAYRRALEAARDRGHSFREIGQAAGVSHVAVMKTLAK